MNYKHCLRLHGACTLPWWEPCAGLAATCLTHNRYKFEWAASYGWVLGGAILILPSTPQS